MVELSVIVPVYKGKQYIKQTIESIKKIQCNKEIIIVDDGSPDDSFEYCKKIFGLDKEIRIERKKNGGIVDARNFGLNLARGKYIMFSDQDDICFPKTVEKAVKLAIIEKKDIVFWSTVYLLEDGSFAERDNVYREENLNQNEFKENLVKDMLINTENTLISYIGHVWSAIYSREIIVENHIRFKKFVDIEDDYLFLFDVLRSSKNVKMIKDVGYAWRYNRKSETYRIKYVNNILERYKNFFFYIEEGISGLEIEEKERERFRLFSIQETIIRSIENEYTFLANSKKEKRNIKAFFNENKDVFQVKSVYNYAKKRKRIYALLKYDLFGIAGIYVFLDSHWRRIKNKML